MLVYIFLFINLFLLSFKIKVNKFTIYDFIFLAIIILFSGLRSVGLDYDLYKIIFNSNFSLESRTGFGFNYLMYTFKYKFHFNYQILIFTISFLTNSLMYYFIKKNSRQPGLSLLIYVSLGFYTTSFNMFRQSLSIMFILLAYEMWDQKRYVKVVLGYLLAFVLHSSSLIAIIVYSITNFFKHKRFKLRYLMLFSLLGIVFYEKLFYIVINSLEGYKIYNSYDSLPGIGTYINVLSYFLITILLIVPKYRVYMSRKENYKMYNLFLVGISIMLLEVKNFLFFRIAFYFTILTPIILTELYEEYRVRDRRIEILVFYLCLFIYFLVYVSSFDGVLPYKLFF